MYKGKAFELSALDEGLCHLVFDLQGESVNKFNLAAMSELNDVLDVLERDDRVRGLLISSGKDSFVVGADIKEFGSVFAEGEAAILAHLSSNNASFTRLESLPFPTVVAVNGYALGGGMEFCLACDYRLAAPGAKLGLPETKLGIIPGWGGTVRLPRLAGVDVAVEWIAGGKENPAEKARADGVVDGVVEADKLIESGLRVLRAAVSGEMNYQARREQKKAPLRHNDMESILSFESSKAFVKAQAGRNYPAPVAAIQAMQNAAKFGRDDALNVEARTFTDLAQGEVAQSLVGLFLADQVLGKFAKSHASKSAAPVSQAAVLGAGIMGGGIAYQSACKSTPILMKDIAESGLQLGLDEASKLLAKQVERGKITHLEMAKTMGRIRPTLSYDGFEGVDVVVEAVVENLKVKEAVLSEVEGRMRDDAVLCSNTSTISITRLAQGLKRPENFCGMHFFNPVHRMPLVEVIRGEKSSDEAIARTVAYGLSLGKKVVVVNDCPGFLVNRVLFPYFAGFAQLLRDGADFQHVDKVMERWGWPMGPAYLMDVVGIDTGVHAEKVMAEGFPDRMSRDFTAASDVLFDAGRLGQKSGSGFYRYETDKKGKLQKVVDDSTYSLLAPHVAERREFSDEEIIARMMLPMANELLRCLDEGVVGSAAEADLALVYGLGFPPFRGGVLRWIDSMGWQSYAAMANTHAELGALYALTDTTQKRVANAQPFYSQS